MLIGIRTYYHVKNWYHDDMGNNNGQRKPRVTASSNSKIMDTVIPDADTTSDSDVDVIVDTPITRSHQVLASSIGVGRAALVSFIMSIGWGLATFLVLFLGITALDSLGFLSKLNALLGGVLELSKNGLIGLSAGFSVFLIIVLTVFGVLTVILYNAASAFVGGLKVTVDNNNKGSDK